MCGLLPVERHLECIGKVSMYIYIQTEMYIHIVTYMYVCTQICMYRCMFVCVFVFGFCSCQAANRHSACLSNHAHERVHKLYVNINNGCALKFEVALEAFKPQ